MLIDNGEFNGYLLDVDLKISVVTVVIDRVQSGVLEILRGGSPSQDGRCRRRAWRAACGALSECRGRRCPRRRLEPGLATVLSLPQVKSMAPDAVREGDLGVVGVLSVSLDDLGEQPTCRTGDLLGHCPTSRVLALAGSRRPARGEIRNERVEFPYICTPWSAAGPPVCDARRHEISCFARRSVSCMESAVKKNDNHGARREELRK